MNCKKLKIIQIHDKLNPSYFENKKKINPLWVCTKMKYFQVINIYLHYTHQLNALKKFISLMEKQILTNVGPSKEFVLVIEDFLLTKIWKVEFQIKPILFHWWWECENWKMFISKKTQNIFYRYFIHIVIKIKIESYKEKLSCRYILWL